MCPEGLTGNEAVDVILEDYPGVQHWLRDRDIICVECGQVFWGSLRELCNYRKKDAKEIDELIKELNEFIRTL